MTCFNHAETVEVGSCAVCKKHLCKDCNVIVRDRLICKSEICKTGLDKKDYLLERSLRIYGYGKKMQIPYMGIALTLFGLYLLWTGFTSIHETWLPLIGGVLVTYIGGVMTYRTIKYHISI